MGTVLHQPAVYPLLAVTLVSVPFSMGTVLHRVEIIKLSADLKEVSVPFSMGTVLHRRGIPPLSGLCHSFSPLLDGDGVASLGDERASGALLRFSPLLDGDGVASPMARASRRS